MKRHSSITAALMIAISIDAHAEAAGNSFPSRPVTIIVPFAAGGPLDTLARVLSERLSAELRQPVIIQNQPGAGGSTGVGTVVRAAADGHTIGIGNWSTHVINEAIYALPYHLVNDLAPVALLTSNPQLIVARKSMPAQSLGDLVGWLKANRANLATAGVGSASHASGLFLQRKLGAEVAFLHYRGGGPALQDVVAGHVDLMFDQVATSLPHIQEGRLKIYAVTSKSRLAVAPDIPTIDEAGLPGFYISVWNGVWAPKGTPAEAIATLNSAFNHALDDAAISKRLIALGQEMPGSDRRMPEALTRLQRAELNTWTPIIKSFNVKAD
jgi:tripartite-type tricarboxylate transporter receptor subunit TctC